MKRFDGFPVRMQFTPIPNPFFSILLPQIDDITELKVILHLLGALYRKRGYPRFVSYGELLNNRSLMNSLKAADGLPEDSLRRALEMTIERGSVLSLVLDRKGAPEYVYFLNTVQDREAIDRIKSGELGLTVMAAGKAADAGAEEMPDIFTLYEQNIGMLTPMIAEELREAEKLYPVIWIQDAVKEAVALNKRNWKYIAAILENWSSQGRGRGAYKRDSEEKAGPDKYVKQKYGHMVQR
ncbi:DnaD domain-containing protein [Chloroflexota bacterium]